MIDADYKKRIEKEIINLKFNIIDQNAFDSYVDTIANIKADPNSVITIIHDKDADGISAGVLMYKFLKKLGIKKIKHFHLTDISYIQSDFINNKLKNSDYLIIMDIPIFNKCELERILNLNKIKKILLIDHHPFDDLNDSKIVNLKSNSVFDCDVPSQYCTSKLAYDLLNLVTDMSDFDWISTIGILGDIAYPLWVEFTHNVFNKYNITWPNNPTNDDLFSTRIGFATKLVSYGNSFHPDRVSDVFVGLKNSSNLADVEIELDFCRDVDNEFNYQVKEFFNNAMKNDNIYILELNSNYHISSQIGTAVSIQNPDSVIIVYRRTTNKVAFSLRLNNFKVNIGQAVKTAASKIKSANGGGHIPAAGARCNEEDFDDFLSAIIDEIKDPKNKNEK